MLRRQSFRAWLSPLFVLAFLTPPSTASAGIGDSIKKSVDKATKEAEAAAGKTTESKDAAEEKSSTEGASTKSGGATSVSAVSTKFDYVPGDSLIFFEDFTQDELGEFPAKWKLSIGTFEVAELEGERWMRCTSPDGTVRMKLPVMTALPEFWTLEMDFMGTEPIASALTVRGVNATETVWEGTYPHDRNLAFRSGAIYSTAPMAAGQKVGGRHHVMFMGRGTAVKGYIDQERLANVPEVAGTANEFEIRLWAQTKPMITNVRFAEGCRPPKDMLAEGKLVTYGICFATGSDVVLPESAPVIRQVASYMESHADVKLKITGHTDNVGSAASNADLSKRRSAAVAKVLSSEFKIAADRFETAGMGDTQPIASNAKPEGKAKNRRVEFAKI
jgi:outer membrane protein OmpA-like peptidoglycan-associated protein